MLNEISWRVSWYLFISLCSFTYCYKMSDGPLLKEKPDWLVKCQRNDPNLDQCFLQLFDRMFPELAKGIPEINVEGFEPLLLDRLTITKGNGAVTLTGSFFNITVAGPSNSTPTYTHINLAEKKMDFGIFFPKLDIRGRYDLRGKILILPLVGHGDCIMTLTGINTKVTTNVSFVEKEGKEIMKIDSMKVMFSLTGIKINLDNLFNGNKILGLTVNNFLNERGSEIVKDLEESIGDGLSQIFIDIINNVFTKMPTDFWLPKEENKKGDRVEKVLS